MCRPPTSFIEFLLIFLRDKMNRLTQKGSLTGLKGTVRVLSCLADLSKNQYHTWCSWHQNIYSKNMLCLLLCVLSGPFHSIDRSANLSVVPAYSFIHVSRSDPLPPPLIQCYFCPFHASSNLFCWPSTLLIMITSFPATAVVKLASAVFVFVKPNKKLLRHPP